MQWRDDRRRSRVRRYLRRWGLLLRYNGKWPDAATVVEEIASKYVDGKDEVWSVDIISYVADSTAKLKPQNLEGRVRAVLWRMGFQPTTAKRGIVWRKRGDDDGEQRVGPCKRAYDQWHNTHGNSPPLAWYLMEVAALGGERIPIGEALDYHRARRGDTGKRSRR